ncbi:MAG: hypothetical protein E7249_06035 [Paenibacillaceae bacterium]|nr:hypothetical protein [Paenibacillaceae bacterium]
MQNYNFSVVAVDGAGEELGSRASISWSTTSKPELFDITDYSAKRSEEGFTSAGYRSEAIKGNLDI